MGWRRDDEGEFFRSVVPDDAVSGHDFDTSVAHPVTRLFGSLELVPPGVVQLDRWHPGGPAPATDPDGVTAYGALGRKL